ncbi:MAG: FAD/NAD(P)-binding protein [Phycisphaerales bacterium]|jgi:NAD(P)H-flavin reductase
MRNPYVPASIILRQKRIENKAGDLQTFDFEFEDKKQGEAFEFICGQFAMLSIDGIGEAPFGIASSPLENDTVQFTIKRYSKGVLTNALYSLSVGDKLGMRGPFGNGYPMDELQDKNILIVGGGFALTTLRSVVKFVLHESNRSKYGRMAMLAAAREPGEMLYRDDLAEWSERDDIEVVRAIDKPADGWDGQVGFAAAVLEKMSPSAQDTYALVCGPQIMIKTCIDVLLKLNFPPERIVNSLEMKMKCGIGKCGRCNIGSKYICKDGPVFTYKEICELGGEF